MANEKNPLTTEIPGNPNPVIEMNEFMDDRVILYMAIRAFGKNSDELLTVTAFTWFWTISVAQLI